ncbi:MAG TPA: hybrid sensor histidine kinase/response regulator [Rhodopila sp.]
MTELFSLEAESQTQILTRSLLELERAPAAADHLEICMRAAHSLKGAARLVGITPAVGIAHVMEDCFVGAQRGAIMLDSERIDLLLEGVELLHQTAAPPSGTTADALQAAADGFTSRLTLLLANAPVVAEAPTADAADPARPDAADPMRPDAPAPVAVGRAEASAAAKVVEARRVLRVTAENFDRLLSLAGESLVESRHLKPVLGSLQRLRRLHQNGAAMLERLREPLSRAAAERHVWTALEELRSWLADCGAELSSRLEVLEGIDSRSTDLARRLYDEALACRMRPFGDGTTGFAKMVRGVSRSLGKDARLEITGEATPVDRDLLETLEAPLAHLLRNAVDHGIEPPSDRIAAGKSKEGTIRLEAGHSAGTLRIVVEDDGAGIDPERLRAAIVALNLAQPPVAEALTDAELLEFLFLPGFTMKTTVTEISGRGVGLDAVRSVIKQVQGAIRVTTRLGQGTRFELRLPLTLSVLRTLLAEIGGEAYAFPLAQIMRTLKLPRQAIERLEGKPHIRADGRLISLVNATQVLGGQAAPAEPNIVSIVLIADADMAYGLVVDRFLGERETVVQPLDPRLGTVADIMAAGVMEDGTPVLIVDVADLMRSVEKVAAAGLVDVPPDSASAAESRPSKRILVVDDSLTVRELERKLLEHAGYAVATAVDGMEGWNMVRAARFDLAITDVDMPRLDGIELVRLIKQHPELGTLPVMIVSYKDDEMDRERGLDAGADYYLPKAGFDGNTLLRAVRDLIGEPVA